MEAAVQAQAVTAETELKEATAEPRSRAMAALVEAAGSVWAAESKTC